MVILGVRTSTYEFGGDTIQSIIVSEWVTDWLKGGIKAIHSAIKINRKKILILTGRIRDIF